MKKIVLMAVIAMCAVFTSQSQAQNILSNDKTQVEKQDKFYEINVTNIPQILQEGVNNVHQDCLIKSVYVSNNSTYVKYKVILVTREGKEMKVYFDDKGAVVKEHSYFK
ncbi:hypothetical protein [Parabacteroides goldsteinii]|uniref:hypothetical protein n=1 Tax=Parabacteroides goldsteinii TaxID=328812 RepID=UPI002675BC32|nr:hypothetical protein [Parabacteroides goldsteinii]